VFREMRKRNEELFYDLKPDFEQLKKLIKNLK